MDKEPEAIPHDELMQLAMEASGIDPKTGGLDEAAGDSAADSGGGDNADGGSDAKPKDGEEQKPEAKDSAEPSGGDGGGTEEPVHSRLAQLTRQDRILREREAKLAEREKALDGTAATQAEAAKILERLKSDPFSLVEEIQGPDAYKKWTKQILDSGQSVEDKRYAALERKYKELEERLAKPAEEEPEKVSKDLGGLSPEDKQAIDDYFGEIRDIVGSGKYVSVAAADGGLEECYEAARLYNAQTGQVMTADAIVQKMDEYYEQMYAKISEAKAKNKPQEKPKEEEPEVADNSIGAEASAQRVVKTTEEKALALVEAAFSS